MGSTPKSSRGRICQRDTVQRESQTQTKSWLGTEPNRRNTQTILWSSPLEWNLSVCVRGKTMTCTMNAVTYRVSFTKVVRGAKKV